jgi:hypothetical protein
VLLPILKTVFLVEYFLWLTAKEIIPKEKIKVIAAPPPKLLEGSKSVNKAITTGNTSRNAGLTLAFKL